MDRRTGSKRRAGFTLVEVLTAIALLLLISLLAIQIVQVAASVTTIGRAKVDVMRNAHTALSILTRDLEGAVVDPRGYAFICAWDGGINDPDGVANGQIQLAANTLINDAGAPVVFSNLMAGSCVLVFTTMTGNVIDIPQAPDVSAGQNYFADAPVTVAYYVRRDGVLVRSVCRNRPSEIVDEVTHLPTGQYRSVDPRYFIQNDMVTSWEDYNPSPGPQIKHNDFELARFVRFSPALTGANGHPPVGFVPSFASPASSVPGIWGFANLTTNAGLGWNSILGSAPAMAGVEERGRLPLAVAVDLCLMDEQAAGIYYRSLSPLGVFQPKTPEDEKTVEDRTQTFHTVVHLPAGWR